MKVKTVLLAAGAIAIAALLIQLNGRGLHNPSDNIVTAQPPGAGPAGEQTGARDGNSGAAIAADNQSSSASDRLKANDNARADVAPTIMALDTPKPMSAENEKRVGKFVDEMAAKDQRYAYLKAMALSDGRDESWSPRTESALMTSLTSNGRGFGGLELGSVRCSRTVCALSATGGTSPQTANADWQRLTGAVMNEPWFGQQFNDTATSMINDGNGMVYITYFVRK